MSAANEKEIFMIVYKKWISFILLIVVIFIIFYFSNQEGEQSNQISDSLAETMRIQVEIDRIPLGGQPLMFGLSLRKYAHIFLYGLVGIFTFFSLGQRKLRPVIAVIICYVFAVFDELHQYFIPGRTAQFSDTLIDMCGFFPAILGCWAINVLWKQKDKRLRKDSL